MTTCRPRRSAPSWAWHRSTPTTREYFFGRERLVAELVARLVGAPLLAVVGPSGQRQVVGRCAPGCCRRSPAACCPGSERWAQVLMRPGAHPLRSSSARCRDRRATVLAVDQFEEVFTACRDEGERRRSSTRWCGRDDDDRRRAGACAPTSTVAAPHTTGSRALRRRQPGPGRPDAARRAAARDRAARRARAGLRVEPALTEALIADVRDEPGGLPLLSAALLEQWRERDGRVMRARGLRAHRRRARRGRPAWPSGRTRG